MVQSKDQAACVVQPDLDPQCAKATSVVKGPLRVNKEMIFFSILCFSSKSSCYLQYERHKKQNICLSQASHPLIRLPHMMVCQFLGSSNSAANKDIMAKIWTNGDTILE